MKSALEKEAAVDAADLTHVLEDFIPPSYPAEIEMQTLIAVSECTRRSLLPEKYRQMPREELSQRLAALRLLNGE
jgi:hypothetical protein